MYQDKDMAFSGIFCDQLGVKCSPIPNVYLQHTPFPNENFYMMYDNEDQFVSLQIALFNNGYTFPPDWNGHDWCMITPSFISKRIGRSAIQTYINKKVMVPVTTESDGHFYITIIKFEDYFRAKPQYEGLVSGRKFGL